MSVAVKSAELQSETTRLREQTQGALVEFANIDLEVAFTFVRLARFDYKSGQHDHAARPYKLNSLAVAIQQTKIASS
jgi:hypothetical protein